MAISLNKIMLIGRLGADPEQPHNGPVKMRVATSESWKDRESGEWKDRTTWHSVVVWNEHAQKYAMKYLTKGSMVYIEGSVETRKWEKDDGSSQYITEIVVRPFTGVVQAETSRAGRTDSSDERERASSRSSPGADRQQRGRPSYDDMDDEIPF